MDLPLVAAFASIGVVMGLVTTLVGIPASYEPIGWFAGYGLWLGVMTRRRPERPFATAVAGSVLAGVAVASLQVALLPMYVANNPWYAGLIEADRAAMAPAFFLQGLFAGTVFGILVGGLAIAMMKKLRPR